jgi:hypothetical protein
MTCFNSICEKFFVFSSFLKKNNPRNLNLLFSYNVVVVNEVVLKVYKCQML